MQPLSEDVISGFPVPQVMQKH